MAASNFDMPSVTLTAVKGLAEGILDHLCNLSCSQTSYKNLSEGLTITALQEVDDVLCMAQSHLRMLRNALSPVNTLPPEILTSIFGTLSAHKVSGSSSPSLIPDQGRPKEWIPLTHVCRYWRRIALGYPFLWSPVIFQPADIGNAHSLPYECLQRSLGAPLDVRINCDGTEDMQVWDKVAERCGRLRKLHVENLVDISYLERFQAQAPILQSLHIEAGERLIERRDGGENVSSSLPLLFSGHTPALRYLTFSFITSLSSNKFANLTELHLSDQRFPTSADAAAFILPLLKASPELEILSIIRADIAVQADLPSQPPAADQIRYITLYRLRQLVFKDCHANIIALVMAPLELSDRRVGLSCSSWHPSERPITSLFPPKQRSHLYSLDAITTLDLNYDTSDLIATGPGTAIRLSYDSDLDVADEIAPSLPAVFPFQTLREIRLAGIELRPINYWQSLFGSLPLLSKLVLWLPPTDSEKWVVALSSENLNGRPYPLPSLHELCVFPPYPAIWDTLVWLAECRAGDGHAIRHLRVMLDSKARDTAIRNAFQRWQRERAALQGFVDNVSFEAVTQYRSVDVPEEFRTFIQ